MAVYQDLAQQYRKKIENGELQQGNRLPIEKELAEPHDVSIATVSRFVKVLKTEGLIYTAHNGTFVGPRPEDPRLQRPEAERVNCANRPRCNNFMELKHKVNLQELLPKVGWIYRGSPQGRVYFCHQCAPKVLEREKEL